MVTPGADIDDPDFEELIFDSNYAAVRVIQSGTINFSGNYWPEVETVAIEDNGYIPIVLCALYCGLTQGQQLAYYGKWNTGSGGFLANDCEIDGMQWGTYDVDSNTVLSGFSAFRWGHDVKPFAIGPDWFTGPHCVMPFMFFDQSSRATVPETGGSTNTRINSFFYAAVSQGGVSFFNWARNKSSNPYYAEYYVLSQETG